MKSLVSVPPQRQKPSVVVLILLTSNFDQTAWPSRVIVLLFVIPCGLWCATAETVLSGRGEGRDERGERARADERGKTRPYL